MAISFLKCMAEACTNVVTVPSLSVFCGGFSLGLAGALGLVERTAQAAANTFTQNRDTLPPGAEETETFNSLIDSSREITTTAKKTKMPMYFFAAALWLNGAIRSLDDPYSTAVTSTMCAAAGCFLGAGAALLVAEKGTQSLVNGLIQIRSGNPRTPAELAMARFRLLIDPIQAAANRFKKVKQMALTTTALFGTALCLGIGISNGCPPFSLASRNLSSIGTGFSHFNQISSSNGTYQSY